MMTSGIVHSFQLEATVQARRGRKVCVYVSMSSKKLIQNSTVIVQFAENIDFNENLLFSGGINPANLPRTLVNGVCTSIFPHQRLRVNTWTEIVTSKGLETAHTDKHPAYDIVRGPSGTGLTTGFFPEIQAVPVTVNDTIAYDQLHVNAFLDWLDGKVPVNSTGSPLKGVPTTFGGNFQAGMSCMFSMNCEM